MQQIVSEQSQAFADFVAARSTMLLRTAFLLTGDRHRAEDLVQVALLKAVRVWGRIEGNPEPYVRKVMYHENISWWRRRRFDEVTVSEPPDSSAITVDVDARVMVVQALGRLTAKQRTVLVLRFLEDLTEVQTAAVLGIGVGTVKSQVRQAIEKLRRVAPELSELLTTAGDVT